MGAPKVRWSQAEEEALRSGVKRHGTGKWKTIKTDAEFEKVLANRSNVDLKDKWRNIRAAEEGRSGAGRGSPPSGSAGKAPGAARQKKRKPADRDAPGRKASPGGGGGPARNGNGSPPANGSGLSLEEMIMSGVIRLKDSGATAPAIRDWVRKRYASSLPSSLATDVTSALSRMVATGKLAKDAKQGTFSIGLTPKDAMTPALADGHASPGEMKLPPKKAKVLEAKRTHNAAPTAGDAEGKDAPAMNAPATSPDGSPLQPGTSPPNGGEAIPGKQAGSGVKDAPAIAEEAMAVGPAAKGGDGPSPPAAHAAGLVERTCSDLNSNLNAEAFLQNGTSVIQTQVQAAGLKGFKALDAHHALEVKMSVEAAARAIAEAERARMEAEIAAKEAEVLYKEAAGMLPHQHPIRSFGIRKCMHKGARGVGGGKGKNGVLPLKKR